MMAHLIGKGVPAPPPVRVPVAPRPTAPRPVIPVQPRYGGGTRVVIVHHWYTPIYTPFHYYMPFPYYGHVSILGFVLVLLALVIAGLLLRWILR